MAENEQSLEIGRRVAQARGELTQAEFAAQMGVDRKTVVRWEAGERVPDGGSLLLMHQHFHVDPGWLLTGKGSAPPLSAKEAALLDNYRHASDAGRKALDQTGIALAQPDGVKRSG